MPRHRSAQRLQILALLQLPDRASLERRRSRAVWPATRTIRSLRWLTISPEGLPKTTRQELDPLLECFVHAEIVKAAALCSEAATISHYRDKDQVEVDLVLERPPGEIVGIEVKSGATVRSGDFKGLVRLKEATGEQFACGIILHDGERIQQTASRLFALPVKMLWEA